MIKFLKEMLAASRAHYCPVIVLPVLLAVVTYGRREQLHSWEVYLLVALMAVGAFTAQMAANLTNDIFDFLSGADTRAHTRDDPNFGGSNILTTGVWSIRQAAGVNFFQYLVALLCGVGVCLLAGIWVPLAVAVTGGLFGFFYVAPPLRFAYFGRGLGEVVIVVCFGLLPVFGAAVAMKGTVAGTLPGVIYLGLISGLLTSLILLHHAFIHPDSDREVKKVSPVVAYGTAAVFKASLVLLALAYVALGLAVFLGPLPTLAFGGVLSALLFVPLYRRFAQLKDDQMGMKKITMGTAGADMATQFIIIFLVVAGRLLR